MQSLVGNTERLGGRVRVPSIAFQPQSPILFDASIRTNILFGIDAEDASEELMRRSVVARPAEPE